jgi:hypothetical protein
MVLSERVKVTKVGNATAAGTGAINSSAVDMAGYQSVMFIVVPGAIVGGATTSMNIAQDTASGGSFTDLLGTGITIADDDDNQLFITEVVQPSKRYVRLEIARAGQNSEFSAIIAIRSGGKQLPVVNGVTDTATIEVHLTPAEGAA